MNQPNWHITHDPDGTTELTIFDENNGHAATTTLTPTQKTQLTNQLNPTPY